MGRFQHGRRQRLGGIDPVPLEPDIGYRGRPRAGSRTSRRIPARSRPAPRFPASGSRRAGWSGHGDPARAPPLPAAPGYRARAWRSCRPSSCATAAPGGPGDRQCASARAPGRAPHPASRRSSDGARLPANRKRRRRRCGRAHGCRRRREISRRGRAALCPAAPRAVFASSLRPPARRRPVRRLPGRAVPFHHRRPDPSAAPPARACGCGRAPPGRGSSAAAPPSRVPRAQPKSRCRRRRTGDGLRRRHSAGGVRSGYRWSRPLPASPAMPYPGWIARSPAHGWR